MSENRFLKYYIKSIDAYVPGEQPPDADTLIKLNTNESPFPPSPRVIRAINSDEIDRLRLYSDPDCKQASAAVADYYSLSPEQVMLGNGSDEVLAFCFMAYCKKAAFPDITYGFYPVFSRIFNVEPIIVPLREDFTIDITDYSGTDATVFIANPNAPTGICLPVEKIEELLSSNRNRLVVVDEAYVDFGGESCVPLLARLDNLIVVQTLSKSRSLAGGRIGIALASPELIQGLNTVKFCFNPYNLNRLSLLACKAAFEDVDYFDKTRNEIIANRDVLTSGLRAKSFTVLESKANFVFACAPDMSGEELLRSLREKNILVRHFTVPRIKDFVRITVGSAEQVKALLEAV